MLKPYFPMLKPNLPWSKLYLPRLKPYHHRIEADKRDESDTPSWWWWPNKRRQQKVWFGKSPPLSLSNHFYNFQCPVLIEGPINRGRGGIFSHYIRVISSYYSFNLFDACLKSLHNNSFQLFNIFGFYGDVYRVKVSFCVWCVFVAQTYGITLRCIKAHCAC